MDLKRKWTNLDYRAKIACVSGGALFMVVGMLGGFDEPAESATPAVSATSEPTIGAATSRPKEKTVEEKPVQYTIIRETNNRAELVLGEPSVENARKAIDRYADDVLSSGSDQPEYVIMVLGDASDKTYICNGRWIRDQKSADIYTGGTVKADKWPHIQYNCPNPKGY